MTVNALQDIAKDKETTLVVRLLISILVICIIAICVMANFIIESNTMVTSALIQQSETNRAIVKLLEGDKQDEKEFQDKLFIRLDDLFEEIQKRN
ncbi:hypothetical protein [Flammeovirga sp. OC4]|uniref:hypothetical protein n=1 Tax=Flammeovirga sp. OC4 TaxID=1382345 RepID=UPI0005C72142|nr:hypothetical protein [Flammeovirga sp. OC4]